MSSCQFGTKHEGLEDVCPPQEVLETLNVLQILELNTFQQNLNIKKVISKSDDFDDLKLELKLSKLTVTQSSKLPIHTYTTDTHIVFFDRALALAVHVCI